MANRELERYRQMLMEILANCAGRRRTADEAAAAHPDVNDLAAVNHARYIADVKEEIHLSVCDAARRALARLEEGEYGLCAECGESISPKRLAAVPWADYCVACQSQLESALALRKAA